MDTVRIALLCTMQMLMCSTLLVQAGVVGQGNYVTQVERAAIILSLPETMYLE